MPIIVQPLLETLGHPQMGGLFYNKHITDRFWTQIIYSSTSGSSGYNQNRFVTGQILGPIKSNGSNYYLGMEIVMNSTTTVTGIGRWKTLSPPDTGVHTLTIHNPLDTPIFSGYVNMTGTPDSDGYVYATNYYTGNGVPATSVQLASGTKYHVFSQEYNGTDTSYDWETVVSGTLSVANITQAYYFSPGVSEGPHGTTNNSYGPVNFKYQ